MRQYEVGRSILLSQLAEAKSTEQQYTIASRFDPFNVIADWKKAEGLVQEKSINARALERVYVDTTDLPDAANPAGIDPAVLESQMARLRAEIGPPASGQASASSTAAGAAPRGANSHHASQESNRST